MASVLLVAKLALWDDPASASSFDAFKDAELDGKAIHSRLASFLSWRHALFLTGSVGWMEPLEALQPSLNPCNPFKKNDQTCIKKNQ